MNWSIIEKCEGGSYDVHGNPTTKVVILADTSADVPAADATWSVGSMCMIAETHTYKVLNNEREWA